MNHVNSDQFLDAFSLPVGVYLVSADGTLLKYNSRLAEILDIPTVGCKERLTDFYFTPSERPEILQRVAAAESKGYFLEGQTIRLRVRGRTVFVQLSCRSVRDEAGGIIGYLGCMVDVTKEQHYRSLMDFLPVGTYELDTDGKIIEANPTTAKLLDMETPTFLIGAYARDFYTSKDEFDAVQQEIKTKGYIENRLIELKTATDRPVLVTASAFDLAGDDGTPMGRHGTLVDATAQEYLQILTESPVGLYVTRYLSGREVVRHCNEMYAKLFGFSSASAAVGTDVLQLYDDHADYLALASRLKRDTCILGHVVRAKRVNGERFDVEVSTKYLRDQAGITLGRVGVVRDVTTEVDLRRRIAELTFDVGRVFHAYSALLIMVKLCFSAMREFLESEHGVTPSSLPGDITAIEENSRVLSRTLDRLFANRDDRFRHSVFSEPDWEELERQHDFLNNYQAIALVEHQPAALRDTAARITAIIGRAKPGHLAREVLRDIGKSTQRLGRAAVLSEIDTVLPAVLDMDYSVRALRESVSTGARAPDPKTPCPIGNLISRAIRNLAEYAQSLGVTLRRYELRSDPIVNVSERDMVRVISNLLHNAYKYSWARDDSKPPWVDLRIRRTEKTIAVELENWGVPIPQDEIDDDSVFELGIRGRLSSDRGRLGTGIGLADARRTARQNGGDVTIKSRPAHPPLPSDPYSVPYITTVTLTLPFEEISEK